MMKQTQTLDQATAEWVEANAPVVEKLWVKFVEDHRRPQATAEIDKHFDKFLQDIVKKAYQKSADLRDEEFRLNLYETRFDAADDQSLFHFVERRDFPKTFLAVGAVTRQKLFSLASAGQANYIDPNLRLMFQLALPRVEQEF